MTAPATIENVTCLGCGCACDDIDVVTDDTRIVEARNACTLGRAWFGDGRLPARSLIEHRDVSRAAAVADAARLLAEASRPLVYLAPGLSCETQREGAAIADMLRARLDTVTTSTALPVVLSAQERGYASSTLGEIRNRADVVVFWAVDVDGRYPRFRSRYAPDPVGTHAPEGRRSRKVIAIDVGGATTVADADQRYLIEPGDELATLVALQSCCHSERASDKGWDTARDLARTLLSGSYIALLYDAETDARAVRSTQRFDALAALAQALNDQTRCAALALRGGGNRSGADSVLTSQTGYPMSVDFGRGYPRYDPYGRNETDLALVLGDVSLLPLAVMDTLGGSRTIIIGPRASESTLGRIAITIDTGVDGIHAGGTAFRTDDVPLPLRAVLPGLPSAADTVREVALHVRTLLA